MTDEFDPTAELGLPPDRYVVCTCHGFLTRNNNLRDLCGRFMQHGEQFFDVLERYDRLTSYVLNREDATAGSYYKWCVPFLKAYGATDHLLYEFSKDSLEIMPNAKRTMTYISNILPSHITTSLYEHGMMEVLERLNVPLCQVADTKLCIDQTMMGRLEARKLRNVAEEIARLKVPGSFYELNVPTELMDEDVEIIKKLDAAITENIPDAGALGLMESTDAITSHKKAYRMLDIRRLTGIDLDSTMYVGSSATDFQPMDLVRDAGGLSIAFNGEEFAVRGSNIAILSEDTTVVSLFASLFADKGPLAAYEFAENWSRRFLEQTNFPDLDLLRTFLREHPDDLPEVYAVNDDNVDDISKKSDRYRKDILGNRRMP
jgi:predicted HAD superfamily phosphohydrolase